MAFTSGTENDERDHRQDDRRANGADDVWDFHTLNSSSEVSRGAGGEYLTKFREKLNKIMVDISPSMTAKVISISRDKFPELQFACIVIAGMLPSESKETVAYHTLILEATGEPLKPIMVRIGQDQVQHRRVTGMAMDDVLKNIVWAVVRDNFPSATNILPYDCEVVPANVDPSSVDQIATIEQIVINSAVAIVSAIKSSKGTFRRLDLSKLDKSMDYQLEISFGNHNVTDLYSRPLRANTLISFTSRRRPTRGQREDLTVVNQADNTALIAEVSGFTQPIWMPQDYNHFAPRHDRRSQCLAAEFVITNVLTPHASSPAAVNLGICNFIALAQGSNWMGSFLPSRNTRGVAEENDTTNVGALNFLANLNQENNGTPFGKPMLLKEDRLDLEKMHSFLTAIFNEGLVVSMDVPEQGPSSWYQGVYAAAANGNVDAENQIRDGFDEITGGRFSELFDKRGGKHLFSQAMRILNGEYIDGGEVKDIRCIDLTAVCTLFYKRPDLVTKYHRAMIATPNELDAVANLADLEEIYMLATDQQARITGTSQRVTFSDLCVEALADSISDCQLPTTVQTPLATDHSRFGVMVPSFVKGSLARVSRGFDGGRNGSRYSRDRDYRR